LAGFEQYPNAPRVTWYVEKPRRVSGFRWSLIPEGWFPAINAANPLEVIWAAIGLVAYVLEFFTLMWTVGPIRLAIHHSRSPGWYIAVTYATRPGIYQTAVQFQTTTKGRARHLRRVLARELAGGAELNSPNVQSAIAASQAVPVAPAGNSRG
jgi:hypothetical protein